MPFYCYICPECEAETSVLKPMYKVDRPERCKTDGALLDRDFGAEAGGRGHMDYAKPFVSDSLAMNPDQIPEHNLLFPEIKVLPDGRPTFKSPAQQDKYLKATGFVKLSKKTKNRVRKKYVTK